MGECHQFGRIDETYLPIQLSMRDIEVRLRHQQFERCHHGMSSQLYRRPIRHLKEMVVMIDRLQGSSPFLTSIFLYIYNIIEGNARFKLGLGQNLKFVSSASVDLGFLLRFL